MKKKFTDIITDARTEYSLSTDERAKMSHVIREYMAHKPLPRTASMRPSGFSFVFFHRPIAATLAFLIVTSSGISYAAENALPGDVLYSVKTLVNEPTRLALAREPEAKAEVQVELAERRIEEATQLAAEGRLDDETQEALALAFEAHAGAVTLSMTDSNISEPSVSTEISARFENRLVAHENVLSEVERESENEATSNSHRLSQAIRIAAYTLAEKRMSNSLVTVSAPAPLAMSLDTEPLTDSAEPQAISARSSKSTTAPDAMPAQPEVATMSLSVEASAPEIATLKVSETAPLQQPPMSEKAASRMKDVAKKSLKAATKALKNAKKVNAETYARTESDIALAQTVFEEGEQALKNELFTDAYHAFEESSRITEQALVYIKAAPTIEKARERALKSTESEYSQDQSVSSESQVGASTHSDNTPSKKSDSAQNDTEDHTGHELKPRDD